jgi:type II secretory pathway pseudopilin PulG
MLQKGAMFGLDARIALAIFGALSVISGAALYSAIQESKVTQNIVELEEAEKAMSAYYLDTGSLPLNGGNSTMNGSELVEDTKSLSTWNGPYIGYTKTDAVFMNDSDVSMSYLYGKDVAWGRDGGDTIPRVSCAVMASGEECHLWVARQWVDESISKVIDERIDGTLDFDDGKVRLWCNQSANLGKCTIYYQMEIPAVMQ